MMIVKICIFIQFADLITHTIFVLILIFCCLKFRHTSYINHTLVSNKIVNHSDAVGASTVSAASATSSFWT